MHSVHVPLTGYFTCPEEVVSRLDSGLSEVVSVFRRECPGVAIARQSLVAESENRGNIYVAFSSAEESPAGRGGGPFGQMPKEDFLQTRALHQLLTGVAAVLDRCNLDTMDGSPALRFALMQCADLPSRVFASAVRFSEGVIEGLDLPARVDVAELALFQYESDAAGDSWEGGSWAVDLRWQILNTYPLAGA